VKPGYYVNSTRRFNLLCAWYVLGASKFVFDIISKFVYDV